MKKNEWQRFTVESAGDKENKKEDGTRENNCRVKEEGRRGYYEE